MSATIIPFPTRYPMGEEGLTLSRVRSVWRVRLQDGGRITELYLSEDELRHLHELTQLAISSFL